MINDLRKETKSLIVNMTEEVKVALTETVRVEIQKFKGELACRLDCVVTFRLFSFRFLPN